jgi:hypothetical protein
LCQRRSKNDPFFHAAIAAAYLLRFVYNPRRRPCAAKGGTIGKDKRALERRDPEAGAGGKAPMIEAADRTVLAGWLTASDRKPSPHPFSVIDVSETRPADADVIRALARVLVGVKSDLEVIRDVAARLGFEIPFARLRASKLEALRRGDFGEALLHAQLEILEQLSIPVPKLRFQVDPEQAIHGTDVVALERDGDQIRSLHFVEGKLRTTVDDNVGAEAHEQLIEAKATNFHDVLDLMLQRIAKEDHSLYESLISYLASRRDNELDEFGIATIFDSVAWREAVLVRVAELAPDLLDPLTIRTIRVADLRGLADAVCEAIDVTILT